MRVTRKGQVTIPVDVRRALGIRPGSDVRFEVDGDGARLVVGPDDARRAVAAMRGTGDIDLSTDEILALTRR